MAASVIPEQQLLQLTGDEPTAQNAHDHRALDIQGEPAPVRKHLHHLAMPWPLPQAAEQKRRPMRIQARSPDAMSLNARDYLDRGREAITRSSSPRAISCWLSPGSGAATLPLSAPRQCPVHSIDATDRGPISSDYRHPGSRLQSGTAAWSDPASSPLA